MQVVLLEKVGRLGQIGDVVNVRDGYARNFLLPQNKALRATKDSLAIFEARKAQIVKENEAKKADAAKRAKAIEGKTVAIIRAASEGGQLYGSVSTRDIADAVSTLGQKVDRTQVQVNQSFKTLGLFPVTIALHAEVRINVTINIARSADEAAIQEKEGRALVSVTAQQQAAAADAAALVEAEALAQKDTTETTEDAAA